jgi:hypothetical protein
MTTTTSRHHIPIFPGIPRAPPIAHQQETISLRVVVGVALHLSTISDRAGSAKA